MGIRLAAVATPSVRSAVCDNGDEDADATTGQIVLEGVVVGTYTVTETDAPEGYQQNTESQSVEVTADTETAVEFTHEPAVPETGTVTFNLNDPDGNPVVGGCLTINSSDASGTSKVYCDGGPEDQNPADGVLELELEAGSYSAQQSELPQTDGSASLGATRAMTNFLQNGDLTGLPAGLSLDQKTFTVKANVVIIVIIIIIIVLPEDGDLVIIKRADDTNQLQTGVCFTITGPGGDIDVCDNDNVDVNGSKGIIRIDDLAFGDYTVEETTAPQGYQLAPSRDVTIGYGVRTISIRNKPIEETTGKLTIKKVDQDGKPLPGACFELRQNNVVVYPAVCDNSNGTPNNGTINFNDVEAGTYRLRETVLPSSDYTQAPDQTVKIVAGATKTYQVVNTLKPGDILITKLDSDGNGPLPGACFALERGSGVEYETCDQDPEDGDFEEGIILFRNIPAGDWTLDRNAGTGWIPAGRRSGHHRRTGQDAEP